MPGTKTAITSYRSRTPLAHMYRVITARTRSVRPKKWLPMICRGIRMVQKDWTNPMRDLLVPMAFR